MSSSHPDPIVGHNPKDFEEYLKSEYDHIAEAHFRTIEAISAFFRYYLLIMSIPISLVGIFVTLVPKTAELLGVLSAITPILGSAFLVIALVGLGMMLYVVNLRLDVILYARTINAIRKYSYDQAPVDIDVKLRTRVLPQTPYQPSYVEKSYFLPVILSFALFNSFYLFWAICLLGGLNFGKLSLEAIPLAAWLGGGLSILVHCIAYKGYAWYREHLYLRSYVLGVDIDGVLNKHREHFCNLLQQNARIPLNPESITTIPIHECPRLEVRSEDERQVFNDPRYWVDMPPLDGAAKNLTKLRNIFKIRIHIFTYRPWPNTSDESHSDRDTIHKKWRDKAFGLMSRSESVGIMHRLQLKLGLVEGNAVTSSHVPIIRTVEGWVRSRLGCSPIDQITKSWLRLNGISYDRLTIEQGNEDVSDPQGHFRNRFYISRKKRIRFFVEDDSEKASKLAYICDIVFLLEQPYNRESRDECLECEKECKQVKKHMPNNVIRVKSWDEIYRHIRRLS